jgi:hypothetical protein
MIPVFYWGDANDTNNGLILPSHFPPEVDNAEIPWNELYDGGYPTGILIPVGGTYRYIQIEAPPSCLDPAQIDSVQIWTPTP